MQGGLQRDRYRSLRKRYRGNLRLCWLAGCLGLAVCWGWRLTNQQGYTDGPTAYWEEDKVWGADPVLLPFKDIPRTGRLMGYAGPPSRASAEAQTKYIIVDMYAKAVQGMAAEDAVKWAHEELVKIYA